MGTRNKLFWRVSLSILLLLCLLSARTFYGAPSPENPVARYKVRKPHWWVLARYRPEKQARMEYTRSLAEADREKLVNLICEAREKNERSIEEILLWESLLDCRTKTRDLYAGQPPTVEGETHVLEVRDIAFLLLDQTGLFGNDFSPPGGRIELKCIFSTYKKETNEVIRFHVPALTDDDFRAIKKQVEVWIKGYEVGWNSNRPSGRVKEQ